MSSGDKGTGQEDDNFKRLGVDGQADDEVLKSTEQAGKAVDEALKRYCGVQDDNDEATAAAEDQEDGQSRRFFLNGSLAKRIRAIATQSISKNEKLTDQHIESAQLLVKQKHPLQYTTLWKTLPFLKPFKNYLPEWVPATDKAKQAEEFTLYKQQLNLNTKSEVAALKNYENSVLHASIQDLTAVHPNEGTPKTSEESERKFGNKASDRSQESVGNILDKVNQLQASNDKTLNAVSSGGRMQNMMKAKMLQKVVESYEDMQKKMYEQELEKEAQEHSDENDDVEDFFKTELADIAKENEDNNDSSEQDEDEDEDDEPHDTQQDDNAANDDAFKSQLRRKKTKNYVKQDPFIAYGVGIRNFFNLQVNVIKVFSWLSLMALVQMIIFGSFNGLEYLGDSVSTSAGASFGSIGFAGSVCGRQVIDWTKPDDIQLMFHCQGTTAFSRVLTSGVQLDSQFAYGTDKDAVRMCYQTKETVEKSWMTPYFNKEAFEAELLTQCEGKQACNPIFKSSDFLSFPSDKQYENINLFAQVGCQQSDEQLMSKQAWGLVVACIGLFMVWFMHVEFRFMMNMDAISEKKLDLKLITVNDYTIRFKITPTMYEKFRTDMKVTPDCEGIQMFQQHLEASIEQQLRESSDLGDKVKIADIQFGFDNAKMLKFLEKRANALKTAKFEKASEIERQMTEYKDKNYEKITLPNSAYLTFLHEEGFLESLRAQNDQDAERKFVYFGEEFTVQRAAQPTNLQWENFEMTRQKRKCRYAATLAFMLVFGIAYFFLAVYSIQISQILAYFNTPPTINCDEMIDTFGEEGLRALAMLEMGESYAASQESSLGLQANALIYHSGAATCYCNEIVKEQGDNLVNSLQTMSWTNHDGSVTTESYPSCYGIYEAYQTSTGIFSIYSLLFSQFVVINAYWIRLLMIRLAQSLRFRSLSLETSFVMLAIFYMNLLNYGLVYMLAPWDSRESKLPLVERIFGGMYTDFNAYWFNDVGDLIVGTMIFNMYYPILEFLMYWALRWLYRAIDQRSCCTNDEKRTRAKTMQGFEATYSGPEFQIHWKYAYILNVVYVTCFFGPGLPILFPIGLCSLIVLYVVERLMVAYSYQRPPMYDSTVNATTLRLLWLAPICYLVSASWMYSNQQVFRNKVMMNKTENFYPPTGHYWYQVFTQITPATPFVVYLCLWGLLAAGGYKLLQYCVEKKTGREVTDNCKTRQMLLDQNLGSFFSVLKLRQRDLWIREEVVCVMRNKMQRLTKSSFEEMVRQQQDQEEKKKLGTRKANRLTGEFNYDILANPFYQDRYLYTPCRFPKRARYVISRYSDKELRKSSLDLVRLVCDLPYLCESRGKKMQFTPEYIYTERVANEKADEDKEPTVDRITTVQNQQDHYSDQDQEKRDEN